MSEAPLETKVLVIVGSGQNDTAIITEFAAKLTEALQIPVLTGFLSAASPSVGESIQTGVLDYQPRYLIVLPGFAATPKQLNHLNLIVDAAQDRWSETLIHSGKAAESLQAAIQNYEIALQELIAQGDNIRLVIPHTHGTGGTHAHRYATNAHSLLPPRYQGDVEVSAAPMGAADLVFDADGRVAWDQIWGDFCDLALAGGPPHRGTLLEPVTPEEVRAKPEAYQQVLAELARGIQLITKLPVVFSQSPGWIGFQCKDEAMALWLLRAIIVENVTVRREGDVIYLPAGPDFRLEHEIKNVITVVAKTHHYWTEHITDASGD